MAQISLHKWQTYHIFQVFHLRLYVSTTKPVNGWHNMSHQPSIIHFGAHHNLQELGWAYDLWQESVQTQPLVSLWLIHLN